jgi:hypothetical protein
MKFSWFLFMADFRKKDKGELFSIAGISRGDAGRRFSPRGATRAAREIIVFFGARFWYEKR